MCLGILSGAKFFEMPDACRCVLVHSENKIQRLVQHEFLSMRSHLAYKTYKRLHCCKPYNKVTTYIFVLWGLLTKINWFTVLPFFGSHFSYIVGMTRAATTDQITVHLSASSHLTVTLWGLILRKSLDSTLLMGAWNKASASERKIFLEAPKRSPKHWKIMQYCCFRTSINYRSL